jgi:hypothetical protein
VEALDPCCLAHDLGGSEEATADNGEQRGREPLDERRDLFLERLDLECELVRALKQLAGYASDDPVCLSEHCL